ncbi:MAG TPA: GAF domain-containing protein [Chloroflexota bacterium]|nr:GAF domain-containing protein [Chloroflexota bacterium]
MSIDLTRAVTSPKRLQALRGLGLLDTPAEAAFDRLTHLATRLLGTSMALISLVDQDRQFFKSSVGLPEPWLSRRGTPLSHSYCQFAVSSGEPLIVEDARAHELLRGNPALVDLGFVAYAGIPLITSGGHALGTFCVIDNQPRSWTDDDISTLRDLAASVMTEFELRAAVAESQRQKLEAERERSHLSTLVNATREGICRVDLNGRCTFINAAGAALLGCQPADLLDQKIRESAIVGADAATSSSTAAQPVSDVFAIDQNLDLATGTIWRRDGTPIPVEFSSRPMREDGRVTGQVVVFRDITLRRSSEDNVRRRVEQLQSIYDLCDAVGRVAALEEIYSEALTGLRRTLEADRASVLLFDPDGVMRFKAWQGLSDDYRRTTEGHSPWSADTLDAQPVLIGDVMDDPTLGPLRDVILGEGIRALGFIPLTHGGRLLGKFMIYYDAPHQFTTEEVHSAQAIASQIAMAIERKRSEEHLSLYREIFARSSEAIAIIDAQGLYIEQNEAHHALVGYSNEELRGQTPAIHFGDQAFAEIGQVLSQSGRYFGESVSRTKDGRLLDVELSAFSVRDGAGEFLCHVGVKRDVTERKRTERAQRLLTEAGNVLANSLDHEKTLSNVARLMVPALADWCVVHMFDTDGQLRRVTLAHADPSKQELAKKLEKFRPVPASPLSRVANVMRTGVPELIEEFTDSYLESVTENAAHRRLLRELGCESGMAVPLRARGRVLGAIALFSTQPVQPHSLADLVLATELARRAALAVDNARLFQEARQAIKLRDEFLSVAAHELKTPITSLRGFAQLIVRRLDKTGSIDPDQIHQALLAIDQQSSKLARLVTQLLEVSRIEAGRLALEPVSTDLSRLVESIVETTRGSSAEHEIVAVVPPEVIVVADALRLEQVLTNLLDNAIKYSPTGGRIDVEVSATGDETVRIAVRDHGIGVPVEHHKRIFDRFYQAHADDYYSGMGLGLYVSRQIVDLHGGRITVESPPDGGSRFVVVLPMDGRRGHV